MAKTVKFSITSMCIYKDVTYPTGSTLEVTQEEFDAIFSKKNYVKLIPTVDEPTEQPAQEPESKKEKIKKLTE